MQKVYCVFQRLQLNIYQSEFVLIKVFSTKEAADAYCDNHADCIWEGHSVD